MAVKTISKKETKPVASKEKGRNTSGKKDYVLKEEDIREMADIMYHQRIACGEQGSPEDDWYKAEEYLRLGEKNQKRTIYPD